MRKSEQEAFEEWLDDEKQETMYDVSGGDWDDLTEWTRLAFYAGWYLALMNLTTRDI